MNNDEKSSLFMHSVLANRIGQMRDLVHIFCNHQRVPSSPFIVQTE